jgi:hypothetical protein
MKKNPNLKVPYELRAKFALVRNWRKIYSILILLNFIIMGAIISVKIFYRSPEILINQVGFYPEAEKTFLVKSQSLLYHQTYAIYDGTTEMEGNLPFEYLGRIWGYHYYRGNFTHFTSEGNFTIRFPYGISQITSFKFSIGTHIFDLAIQRAYEFFYYQRSNTETKELVPGYPGHKLDHMDDGVIINGEWRDLYGGWFSAGDYNKHTLWGMHIFGTIHSMLYAYQQRPEFYNRIDLYSTDGSLVPDGIPDILNEAKFGINYALKLILPNGTILGSLSGVDLKFAAPERDTDQVIGTEDDRIIDPQNPITSSNDALWLAAGLGRFAQIIKQTGYFAEEFQSILNQAEWIFMNHTIGFNVNSASLHPFGGASLLAACLALDPLVSDTYYKVFGNWALIAMKEGFLSIVQNDSDLGGYERALGLMIEWALYQPSVSNKVAAISTINYWSSVTWEPALADPFNFFRLAKIYENSKNGNNFVLFKSGIGINALYLNTIYALTLADVILNGTNPMIKSFRSSLSDWILGKNPASICMMESLGSKNLPAYHHRYAFTEDNPRGAVPGAIPNGYILKYDQPYVDLSPGQMGSLRVHNIDFESNEPWLPHNIAFLLAFSSMTHYAGGK